MYWNKEVFGKSLLTFSLVASLAFQIAAEEQEAHKGTLQNWEMYGSVRVAGEQRKRYKWYNKLDSLSASRINLKKWDVGSDSVLLDTLPITSLRMGLQNNSYFGVRGKGEKFGFGFEMGLAAFVQEVGLEGTNQSDISSLSLSQNVRQSTMLRKIYGDWFINDFVSFRIGQDWNIANFFISNQIFDSDAGLGYCGILYTGRKPQVKLTVGSKREVLDWKVETAVVKQDINAFPGTSFSATNGYLQKTEEKLPKFEIGGELSYRVSTLAEAKIKVVGGLTQYDVMVYKEDDLSRANNLRAPIKSNLLGVRADLKVWKASLGFAYAQFKNPASYGVWVGNPNASLGDPGMVMFFPTYSQIDTPQVYGVKNAHTKQGGLVLNVQALSWLAWEAGAGKVIAEHDDSTLTAVENSAKNPFGIVNALTRWAYYTNLQISVADDHFHIVPEFSFSDFGGFTKNKGQEGGGKLYSYGLKLELDI